MSTDLDLATYSYWTSQSRLTQRRRGTVSRPIRWIINNMPRTLKGERILHYGEGKAYADTYALTCASGVQAVGYDPNSEYYDSRWLPEEYFDVVIASYVLNVLPPKQRAVVIGECLAKADIAIFAVRTDKIEGRKYEDGVITSRNTFQKSYGRQTKSLIAKDFPPESEPRLKYRGNNGFAIITALGWAM